MTAIANLPRITGTSPLTANDAVPFAKNGTGAAYTFTLEQLLTYMQATFTSPTFTVQTATVTTGNSVAVTSAENTWLILTTTSIASLIVRLPDSVTAFDGQEVIITIDGSVADLAIGANGCDTNGAPASCDSAGLGVRMRFQLSTLTWYCVTNHGNSFDSIRLESGIRDDQNNEVIDVESVGSAVNHIAVTNAATGNAPVIEAAGDDTNVDLTVRSKGTGSLDLQSPSGDVNVTASAGNVIADATALGTVTARIGGVSKMAVNADFVEFTVCPSKPVFTFATLPAAAAVVNGACAIITDCNTATNGANAAGGGAIRAPVNSNGAAWIVG